MPKIKFILIRCSQCQAEYRVRVERVEDGAPFECLTCGKWIEVQEYVTILKSLHAFSIAVLDVEQHGHIDGNVFIPRRAASSLQGD